jgi:hypothetical protein
LIKAELISFSSYLHTKKISSIIQISTFLLEHEVLLGFENLCLIRTTEKSIINIDNYYNSLAIVIFNKQTGIEDKSIESQVLYKAIKYMPPSKAGLLKII